MNLSDAGDITAEEPAGDDRPRPNRWRIQLIGIAVVLAAVAAVVFDRRRSAEGKIDPDVELYCAVLEVTHNDWIPDLSALRTRSTTTVIDGTGYDLSVERSEIRAARQRHESAPDEIKSDWEVVLASLPDPDKGPSPDRTLEPSARRAFTLIAAYDIKNCGSTDMQ